MLATGSWWHGSHRTPSLRAPPESLRGPVGCLRPCTVTLPSGQDPGISIPALPHEGTQAPRGSDAPPQPRGPRRAAPAFLWPPDHSAAMEGSGCWVAALSHRSLPRLTGLLPRVSGLMVPEAEETGPPRRREARSPPHASRPTGRTLCRGRGAGRQEAPCPEHPTGQDSSPREPWPPQAGGQFAGG